METLEPSQEEGPPPTMSDFKPQIECITLFVKELQAAADDYSKEVNQRYEPSSWQAECAAKLKTARDILDVLVEFLETPGGQNFTQQLLATFTLKIKTFAELLGPVLMSFSISVFLCSADARLHKSAMKEFRQEINSMNDHLERLKLIMLTLTNMIAEAGEQLKAIIQVCSSVSTGGQATNSAKYNHYNGIVCLHKLLYDNKICILMQ